MKNEMSIKMIAKLKKLNFLYFYALHSVYVLFLILKLYIKTYYSLHMKAILVFITEFTNSSKRQAAITSYIIALSIEKIFLLICKFMLC